MDLLFLRIIILIIFCATGFLVGNWVANKPVVSRKQATNQEECKDTGICPVPEEYLEKIRKKGGE